MRELTATKHGRLIAEASGFFEVPRILSYQAADGVIEFEFIADGVTLKEALIASQTPPDTLNILGNALAAIHSTPLKADIAEITLPWKTISDRKNYVFLHGDFQVENILFRPDKQTNVFVDWSAPFWLGGSGNAGPADVDLGVFILSLFVGRLFRRSRIMCPEEHALNFLKGYLEGGGTREAVIKLQHSFSALCLAYLLAHKGARDRLRMISYLPSLMAACLSVHRLSRFFLAQNFQRCYRPNNREDKL